VLKSLALLSSFLLAAGAPATVSASPQEASPAVSSPSHAASASRTAAEPAETPPSETLRSEAVFQFTLGKMLAEEHSYRAALAAFEKAVELDPDDPYLRIEYIQALGEAERPVRELTARKAQVAKLAEQAGIALELAPDNVDVLRTVGQVYLRMADFDPDAADRAFEAFSKVRQKEPWDIQTMVALGQLHLSRSQFAEAADIFAEASRYVPNNRILYNFLADARERAGQDKEAVEALQRILSLDPGDVGTRIRLAEMLGRLDDHEAALQALEEAPPSVQGDERLIYLGARELFLNDRPKEALERIQRLDKEGLNRRLRLYVTDLRARILASLGRGDEALDEMAELLDLDPGNVDLLRRVTAQMAQGGQRDEARDLLEAFIDRHRSEVETDEELARAVQTARLALAAFRVEDEAWEPALEVLRPMLASADDETRRTGEVNTAEILYRAGRTNEALALLERSGAEEPTIAHKRVELLLRNGQEGKAKRLLRAQRTADDPELGLAVVQAFHAAERFEDTVPVLEALAEKHSESLEIQFLRGAALERTGDARGAAAAFERVLELDPKHAQTLNYLGYMWADRGENLERARELILRAVDLDPQNGAYIDSLGWVLYRLGQLSEAQQHLERAVRLAPGDPVVYEHLGDVYVALGETGKAAEFYRLALQVAGEDGGEGQDLGAVQRKLDGLAVD